MRHGRQRRSSAVANVFKVVGAAVAVAAVSVVSAAAYAALDVSNSLNESVELVAETPVPEIVGIGAIDGPLNILLVGSDSREGYDVDEGEDAGGNLNDVNMLLHVSADHQRAFVISFPRDLMVPIPSCPSEDGTPEYYAAMSEQPLNSALQYGGLACAALTIQELTGISINYAAEISFSGVINMSNAIGGVPVCVAQDINDIYTGLSLTAGEHVLSGRDALLFLRTRYGIGSGGDTSRIGSQQAFLSSMVRTIKSAETLTNPTKVYALAKTTAENLTLSSTMNSVPKLLSIAATIRDINTDEIAFIQYPSVGYAPNPNKVAPDYASAQVLIDAVINDLPVEFTGQGEGAQVQPDPQAPADPAAPEVPADPADPTQATTAPAAPPETVVTLPPNATGQRASDVGCVVGN